MNTTGRPDPGGAFPAEADGIAGPLRGSARTLVLAVILGAAAFALCLSRVNAAGLGPDTKLGGDAVYYDRGGRGVAALMQHPQSAVRMLWKGDLSDETRAALGLEAHYNSGLLRSPTYAVFLGVLYLAGNHDLSLVGIAQSLLVGLTVVLTCLAAVQLLGFRPGLAAGLIALGYASLGHYAAMVLTETMALFLLTLTVTLLVQVHTRPGPRWALGLGIAVVFLGLCRITYQFLIPVLAAVLIWDAVRSRNRRKLVLFLVGVAVVLAPWFLFSARMFGKPLLAAPKSETAYAMYRGNYAPEDGWENDGIGDYWSPELRDAATYGNNEGVLNEAAYLDGWKRTVKADPARYAVFVLRKACRLWSYPAGGWFLDLWGLRLHGQAGLHRILVLLGMLGAALALRDPRHFWYAPFLLLYITGIHAVTHVESRFALPFMPLVITLAVALVAGAVRAGRRASALLRRTSVRSALAVLGVLTLLSAFVDLGRLVAVFGAEHPDPLRAVAIVFRLSPLAGAAWLLYAVFRTETGRGRALAAAAVPAAAVAVACAGSAWENPAWREWNCRLNTESQAVVQDILIPPNVNWDLFGTAAIQIDMLPALRSRTPVVVSVDGNVVKTYPDGLEVGKDKFLYSEDIQGDRWDRLYNRLTEILGDLGLGDDVGLEYFRQWYTIPVDLAAVVGKERIRVEVRTGRRGGGGDGGEGITVFGDYGQADPSGERIYFGPSFALTLYEVSTYKVRMTAGVRRAADYRLYQPLPLGSPGSEPAFMEGGDSRSGDLSPAPGRQTGEYRIRLDLGLKGMYYAITDSTTGEVQLGWAVEPIEGMEPATGPEIRSLESQKDIYFTGHVIL